MVLGPSGVWFLIVIRPSGVQLWVIKRSDNRKARVQFDYHEYNYWQNWTTRSPVTNLSYPFQFLEKQIHLEQISSVETKSSVKNSSILEIPGPVFLWKNGCCYGYRDHFCDWWLSWVDLYDWLLQLSGYRYPITANCPITTVQNDQ